MIKFGPHMSKSDRFDLIAYNHLNILVRFGCMGCDYFDNYSVFSKTGVCVPII